MYCNETAGVKHFNLLWSLTLRSSPTGDCVQTYWWTWGWRSGWRQPTLLCVQESVSPEPPGSRHRECPEETVLKITTHTEPHTSRALVLSLPLSQTHTPPSTHPPTQTCFLRLFITPMMLDSCLYSSLLTHFLSPFFLEHAAFSAGEAAPVMLPGLLQPARSSWTAALRSLCAAQLRAPWLLKQALLTWRSPLAGEMERSKVIYL